MESEKKHHVLSLSAEGHHLSSIAHVTQVSSLAEAMAVLSREDYIFFLVDGALLGPRLPEALQELRSSKSHGDPTPILCLVNEDEYHSHAKKSFSLSLVEFLLQPVDKDTILAKFHDYLERGQTSELTKSKTFLNSLIQNLPNMVFVKDAKELRFVRFNKAGEDLLGYRSADLIGKNDYDFFPKAEADHFTAKDRDVLKGKAILDIPEEVITTKDKGTRILHTKKIPLYDSEGRPEYLLGISEDITEQRLAEKERMKIMEEKISMKEKESAARRMTILAEASALFASSLDFNETLSQLAHLIIPQLADWTTITMIKEDGSIERLVSLHADHSKQRLLNDLEDISPESKDKSEGISFVVRSGKSQYTPIVPQEQVIAAAKSKKHLELMQELGCRSCMLVPIIARKKILGSIAFVYAEEGKIYSEDDLALAEEICRRAGNAIDNALLYRTAQKAIQSRDDFLSIASHELKTPITSLKLQLQMILRSLAPDREDTYSKEKVLQVITKAEGQIDRLTALVEDLLDISRIEAGKLAYSFERLDISKLVGEIVERYHEHFLAEGTPLSFATTGSVTIRGDKYRLEQVLLNLLTNAGKYGAKKPIEVSLKNTGPFIQIDVKDHGIGIPPDKINKVFERFERAVSSKSITGLGLGLYITREIVKAHNGRISVVSEMGKGSTFTVVLPNI